MLARNAGRIIGVGDGKDYHRPAGSGNIGGGVGLDTWWFHLPKILVKQMQ